MLLRNRKTGQYFDQTGKRLKRSMQQGVSAPASTFFKPTTLTTSYAIGEDPNSLIRMSFDFYRSLTGVFQYSDKDKSRMLSMASSAVAFAQQAPDLLERIYARFSAEEK